MVDKDSSVKRLRHQELGIITVKTLSEICIVFEDLPLWLSVFNKLIQDIGRRKFKFETPSIDSVLYLVSGSLIYVNDQQLRLQNKRFMGIIASNKTYRKLPS